MADKKETKVDVEKFVARKLAAINKMANESKKAAANERVMKNL